MAQHDVAALMKEYAEKINAEIGRDVTGTPAPAAAPAPTPRKKVTAKKGEVLLSKIWGLKPSQLPCDDRSVRLPKREDWSDFMQQFIVEPDPCYTVNKSTVVASIAVLDDERTLAIGATGSGKSHMFREIAARFQMPFYRQQQFEDMNESHLIGMMQLENGSTVYKEAPLVTFVREGGIFCLDEIYRAPASVNMLLQNLLEENGFLMLPEGVPVHERKVLPHKEFRICGTDNSEGLGDTSGHFITARRQDTAFLNRWSVCLRVDYPSAKHEFKRVTKRYPDADKELVEKLIDLAALTRQGQEQGTLELAMSPREIFAACRQVERGYTPKHAISSTYLMKLPHDQEETAKALVMKVFP